MILKFTEKQKINKVKELQTLRLKVNESSNPQYLKKLEELADFVSDILSNDYGSYTKEDVLQVMDIADRFDQNFIENFNQLFIEGLAEKIEQINLAWVEEQIIRNACWDIFDEFDVYNKYTKENGYYSEYPTEDGEFVKYQDNIDADGRFALEVITDPVNNDTERVFDISELREKIKERIAWEESNNQGDWDPDSQEE